MSTVIAPSMLDHVLALQLTVAWAGEGKSDPPRLGWWQTDLVDELGGGDLLKRLLPKTHAWGALQAVREAARRTDASARQKMSAPDSLRSLFFWGFAIDELLEERLQHHKRSGIAPSEALKSLYPLDDTFKKDSLATWLSKPGATEFKIVPGGRQLKGAIPNSIELAADHLAAALVPFAEQYPVPFYAESP
jgi:hypothetical protein